jgi:hypothetical protein
LDKQEQSGAQYNNRQYIDCDSSDFENITVELEIDENTGKETLHLRDSKGKEILDESLARKVKRTDQYKDRLENLRRETQQEIIENTEKLITIYRNSEQLVTMKQVKEQYAKLEPQKYEKQSYSVAPYSQEDVKKMLYKEATKKIKTWKFWTVGKLRRGYVDENIVTVFSAECSKWEAAKKQFEENENKTELEQNALFLKEYEAEKDNFEKIIAGDDNYIETTLEQIFAEIELPLDFSTNFEVKDTIVHVDLDLPEIEDYPDKKAEILQSGKLSVKKKTQAEINKDYATSVFGLAFYFASIIYNISPAIQTINIAGYTQRLNKKTGGVEDQYIYTIEFDRTVFSRLKIKNIDPIEAVDNFKNEKSINAKFELKTIPK